ncbi:MAG: hypothetical protein GC179_29785 [Anaerolineaceae bacterium]|nr:hypothetical protein [Anaerolineaceae bacterium]
MAIEPYEELRQILMNQIDEAFLNNRYPGDDGIGGDEVSKFSGKWQDIPLETIIYNRSVIAEFSTEGFAYYLPAFLKAIITHHQEVDVLADKVLLSLTPPEIPGDRFLIKVIEELDTKQKWAVRDFLAVYEMLFPGSIISGDLRRAISYWSVPLSNVPLGERQQVVKTIELAWKDSQYPGDDKLINTPRRDDAGELWLGFAGNKWQDVPLNTLIKNRDNFFFFTPEAFTYYLSALMTASILHYETVDILSHNVIFHLDPDRMIFGEIMTKFNSQQKQAVRLFLETCAKLDFYGFQYSPTELRILNHWKQHE